MSLSILVPPNDGGQPYPAGTYFKVQGGASESETTDWVLGPKLEFAPGSTEFTFDTIMVRFKEGQSGLETITLRDLRTCHTSASAIRKVTGATSNCCCVCKECGCDTSPTPTNQGTCASCEQTGNSIRVDQYFQTALQSSCHIAIETLGGELNLCFHRLNGANAPTAGAGLPVGNGGNQGGWLGFYRQLFTTSTPDIVQGVQFEGGIVNFTYFAYDGSGNKLYNAGPGLGNTLIQYSSSGQFTEVTQERTYFDYDSTGRYYRQTALNGGQVYFSYDANNHLQRISGDFPGEVYFSYDSNSNVSQMVQRSLTDPTWREWDLEYQPVSTGRAVSRIIGPDGCITYFGYDSSGDILLEVDPLNFATYYEYADFSGTGPRITKLIQPNSTNTTFSHDETNLAMVKAVQDPPLATYFVHDAQFGRIANVQLGLGTPKQAWGFDANANNNQTLDRLGRASYFNYDNAYNLTKTLDPLQQSTYFGFDVNNRTTQAVGIRWQETGRFVDWTTYYAYDTQGNKIKTVDDQGNTTLNSYIRGALMVQTLNPRGFATYYGYDAYGRQMTTLDALSNSTYFGYDIFSNQTQAVSPRWVETGSQAGFTTYYVYDLQNRLTQSIDAAGDITEHDYSARCADGPIADYQLVSGVWRATYYVYDGLSRKVRTIDALQNNTTAAYVGSTQLVSQQTDARGNGMYFGYDGEKRQIQTQDALGGAAYFGYDVVGNRTQSVSIRWPESTFAAFTSYYTFDALNRQVSAQDPVGFTARTGYNAGSGVVRNQDKRGNTTYFEYDTLDRLSRTIDALGQASLPGYDANSNRVRFQDNRGNTTYYVYDALDRQSAQIDPLGNQSSMGYDAASNMIRQQDPRGNVTYYNYDHVNRRTATIDALNEKVYFSYDEAGNRTQQFDHITASSFALTYFGYDKLNRQVKTVDALGRTNYFEYDPNGNLTRNIAPGSAVEVTVSGYDALNRLNAMISPFGASTYYAYDAAGNQTRLLNARGYATYFGYDPLNRGAQTLDALQGATYFGYDPVGNRTTSVGIRWKETSSFASFTTYYQYDALNRVTSTIDPVGSPWLRGYDPNSNLTAVLPPVGGATYYQYEARNLLQQITNPIGDITYLMYDAAGNRVVSIDGYTSNPETTYFGYDALNRLAKMLDAVGGATYFGYDIAGNTARVQDPLLHTTYFAYDLIDRLTSVTDALLNSSYFFYDLSSNRNVEVDANNHAVYYFYDTGNRLTTVRDALGVSAYYGYDQTSNLAQTLDNDRIAIYFQYDALDRRTNIIYPVESQYFGYDAAANLTATRDAWGGSYFAYDTLSRLSQRSTPRGDAVYYGYDLASNLTRLTYPQGLAACYYGYDLAQRNDRLRAPSNNSAYYRYDIHSNVGAKKFGNGMMAYYTYDNANRVASIRYVTSANVALTYFDYGRDIAGRITKIGREADLAIYYTYDNVDRLTSEIWRKKSTSAQIYAFSYSYDPVGNRLKMRREAAAGVQTESAYYSYAADNSLTKKLVFTPPSISLSSYFYYDANGSRTVWVEGTNATYYAYAANRLPTSIAPPKTVEAATYYYYDANWNRYCENQAGTLVYFLWDSSLNLLEERNADGSLKARYTHGYAPIKGIGSVMEVQRIVGSTTYFQYPLLDVRGSVYAVTDANQAKQLTYSMDAFGRLQAANGGTLPNVPNDLIEQSNVRMRKIGGKWYLVFRNRIVPVDEAAFINRDYLRYLNLYRLWSNNPVGQVDRDGLADANVVDDTYHVDPAGRRDPFTAFNPPKPDEVQIPASLTGDGQMTPDVSRAWPEVKCEALIGGTFKLTVKVYVKWGKNAPPPSAYPMAEVMTGDTVQSTGALSQDTAHGVISGTTADGISGTADATVISASNEDPNHLPYGGGRFAANPGPQIPPQASWHDPNSSTSPSQYDADRKEAQNLANQPNLNSDDKKKLTDLTNKLKDYLSGAKSAVGEITLKPVKKKGKATITFSYSHLETGKDDLGGVLAQWEVEWEGTAATAKLIGGSGSPGK